MRAVLIPGHLIFVFDAFVPSLMDRRLGGYDSCCSTELRSDMEVPFHASGVVRLIRDASILAFLASTQRAIRSTDIVRPNVPPPEMAKCIVKQEAAAVKQSSDEDGGIIDVTPLEE